MIKIMLQCLKSWVFGFDLSFNHIEIELVGLLKNEKIIAEYNPVFIEFMECFESWQLLLAELLFNKAHLLFAVSDASHEAIFIRVKRIDNFIVLQKLVISEHILDYLILFYWSFHTVIYQIIKIIIKSWAISSKMFRPVWRVSKMIILLRKVNYIKQVSKLNYESSFTASWMKLRITNDEIKAPAIDSVFNFGNPDSH